MNVKTAVQAPVKRRCCIAQTELYGKVADLPSELLRSWQFKAKDQHGRGFPASFGRKVAPMLVFHFQASS